MGYVVHLRYFHIVIEGVARRRMLSVESYCRDDYLILLIHLIFHYLRNNTQLIIFKKINIKK